MGTKLLSLLVGVAVLGSAGAVDAADGAAPSAQKVVVLTDTQMDGVTAGIGPILGGGIIGSSQCNV